MNRLSILLLIVCAVSPLAATPSPINPNRWTWRFVAGGAAVGPGAFDERGVYYFVAEDRYLHALDSRGTLVWRSDLGLRPAGHVVAAPDGSIYVTLANGELLAVNRDGRLLWRLATGDGVPLAPVVLDSGLVVVAHPATGLTGVTHTGRQVWSIAFARRLSASPVVGTDGRIYVSTEGAQIEVLDGSGRALGRRFVGEAASVLAAGPDGLYIGTAAGRVILLGYDLEPRWRADVGDAITGLTVGPGADVYAVTRAGGLARITAEGVLAWRTTSPEAVTVAHLVGDQVIAAMAPGTLACLASDARVVWQSRLQDRPRTLVLAPYGALLVSGEGWITWAYATDFVVRGPWPEPRGGIARRGVPAGVATARPAVAARRDDPLYVTLESMVSSGSEAMQLQAIRRIERMVDEGEDLGGRYHYLLSLCETLAGAQVFGPTGQFGPRTVSLQARRIAIEVLGRIGDLQSSRFLARLLTAEPDVAMQALIIGALGGLATGLDAELVGRLHQTVRRDMLRGPSDRLAQAVVSLAREAGRYGGGYVDPGIADVLILIVESGYSRETRNGALLALRELSGVR